MNQICDSAARKGFISSEMGLGMILRMMASMVVLLIGTPVASAEQTAIESVKSTINEVIHCLSN